jgi:hypothetical protein
VHSVTSLRVIAPWLADFLRGGSSYTTHLWPSPENVDRLVAGGVEHLIVHVRDPRQVLVSAIEHVHRYPREMLPSLRDIVRRDPRAAIDGAIEEIFPRALAWVVGWAQARSRLDISFTTFEEFARDPLRFVDRLVALYGGDSRWFDRSVALHEPASADFHRRRGEPDEWRRLLDAEQTKRVNAMVPDELWSLFGWSP